MALMRRPVDGLEAVQLGLELLGAALGDGNGCHVSCRIRVQKRNRRALPTGGGCGDYA
jgi:hypothetical protein